MAKTLGELAALAAGAEVIGDKNLAIKDIEHDSRKIGEGAFYGCSSLDSIFIPNGLINIGKYAFDRCHFPQKIREQLTARFGKIILG